MGNVFGGFGGGSGGLSLSNGGTDVFLDVLTLAVSDLARDAWDFRFAALLALQDQSVMGRGAVGFDLEEIDWGTAPAERARAKGFVVRVVDLALRRHRWDELGYEPPFAEGYLRRFRAMVSAFGVEAFEPAEAVRRHGDGVFPGPDGAAVASCVPHRVLSALPYWDGCRFCHSAAGQEP
ncbi:hypothetical protein [Streptomyces sp. NPDC097640]|uniref:hypothetical protein n=1 Tax=Streptomyces sp. NPDC097640 TaxID=3157229 RepID=UPI00331A5D2C